MRIGNRLFPYPVLNNNRALSDYSKDVNFELVFDDSKELQEDGYLKLNNIHIQSNDKYLSQLARDGRVKGLLIVECSNSIFRKKYDVSFEPRDIEIPASDFAGEVQISAFIYAAEDIDDYIDPNFVSDYNGYHFKVEKYCVLAADDTLHVYVDNQPNADNRNSSIFTIIRGQEDGNVMRCQSGVSTGKIEIILPPKYYENYMALRLSPGLLNASFATIAIPVLTERLMDIQNRVKEEYLDNYTLDDICSEFRWFRAVMKAFERIKGYPLTVEHLKSEVHPMELAQIILNSSTCRCIEELSNFAIGTTADNEELSNE